MDKKAVIGLSHLLTIQRSMEVIANNLANVSTPAFKRESVRFEEFLKSASNRGDKSQATSLVRAAGTIRDLSQGRLVPTGAAFDLAISGRGFFAVQTAGGERYTRNGHLSLDANGQIVTDAGNLLLGDSGPVVIPVDSGDIHVASDGTVSGKQGQIAKLRLVEFASEIAMRKESASLYASNETPRSATNAEIVQGMLESSNVEPVVEITRMIEAMRAYEMTAGLLKDKKTNALERLSTFK